MKAHRVDMKDACGVTSRVLSDDVNWQSPVWLAYRLHKPAEQEKAAEHKPIVGALIKWNGGECPVPSGTRVFVKYSNAEATGVAEYFNWCDGGILQYSVIYHKEAQA